MTGVRNSHVTEFAILLAVLVPITASRADNFTTAANQFFGIPPQTWNDAVWQSGPVSPTAGNTFEVLSGGLIRNPTDSATETFPGDSLMLDTRARLRITGWSAITLNFPGTGDNPGLILNGGRLQIGGGASDEAITIAGQVSVVANSIVDQGWRSRPIIVTAQISGSNNLTLINGNLQTPVDIQSANNPYTGSWFVRRGALKGTGDGSLGTGSITIANGGRFEVNYDIQSPGTLTLLGGNSVMVLHQNCQFGAVTINGVTLGPDTYSYDALVAQFPGSFADGGSGSITILDPTAAANDPATMDDGSQAGPSSVDSTATPDASASPSDTGDGSGPATATISLTANIQTPLITDLIAPTVPSGVTALVNSSSQITISWNISTDSGGSGLSGYRVYRNGTLLGATQVTRYVDTGLLPNTAYCYTVVAFDIAGNVSLGSALSCATTAAADATAPAISTAVIVSVNSSSQITIGWNNSTDTGGSGLAGYRVYRDGTLVGTTNGTSYVDTGLSPGTQYCYTVVTYDNAGNISASSALSCATTIPVPDTTGPTIPNGTIASANSSSQISVSWNVSTDTGGSGMAGYEVYRNGIYVNATTATSYVDAGLSANTLYCYSIMAYDRAGNISSASAQACATTTPAPPKQLTLAWDYDMNPDPSNAPTGFVFLRDTKSPPAIIVASTSDGPRTNWVDTAPIPGVTNYYQIVAYNSAGTSGVSNVASGLPH